MARTALRGLGPSAFSARGRRAPAAEGGLPPLDRELLEPRFGHDFSRVRVLSGALADASARALGARAFAVGSQIAFARDAYAPDTDAGLRLLAHELAHVVQHERGAVPSQRVLRQLSGSSPELYAIQVSSAAKGMRPGDACHAVSSYDVTARSKSESRTVCERYVTPPCQPAVLIVSDFYHHVQPDPPEGTAAPFKLTLAVEREVDGSSEVPLRKGGYDDSPEYGPAGTSLRTSFGGVTWIPLEGTGTVRTVASMEHPHGRLSSWHKLPYRVTPCEKKGGGREPAAGEPSPGGLPAHSTGRNS